MIVIKIILIVLQFSFFVMCIENEGKALRFCAVSFLFFAILNFFRLRSKKGRDRKCQSGCRVERQQIKE